jgi:hypothetical protein
MDRSYLSRPEVIAASRRFVCVRLTTYEDELEARFNGSLMLGRSGNVENTTFVVLAPDGKTKLTREARSAKQVYADAAAMARGMDQIAAKYPPKPADGHSPPLPVTLTARLGLDVAASDGQPLVLVVAKDESTSEALEAAVAELAWGREFLGRFVYASAASVTEVPGVPGLPAGDGVTLIEPDPLGQAGAVVKYVAVAGVKRDLAAVMRAALAAHKTDPKNERQHRTEAVKQGAFWKTKLPVGDPMEAAARERTKQAIERAKKK